MQQSNPIAGFNQPEKYMSSSDWIIIPTRKGQKKTCSSHHQAVTQQQLPSGKLT